MWEWAAPGEDDGGDSADDAGATLPLSPAIADAEEAGEGTIGGA